jgi:L-ribulose-5-phosphate 3-epimerase
MPRPRLGYPTRLLDVPLRDKIRLAASFGATGAQFDLRHELRAADLSETGRRQLCHLLDEQRLDVAPPVFPLRRALIDPEGLEERVAAVTAAMRFAADLKANALIIRPGAIPAADAGERRLFTEVLNDLARAGDHVGVTLSLTTGREAPGVLAGALAAVTTGPVGANLDPAACVMAGHDPAGLVRELHDRLNHVRIRDGLRESDGTGTEVPVGRGEVQWETLFAALAEAGYESWFAPDRTTGDDPAGDAARALKFATNVMPF